MRRRLLRVWVGMVVLMTAAIACRRIHDRNTEDPAASGPRILPPLVLRDDTPNLLLTWVDAKGDAHVATQPQDVPMEGRDQVRAVITDRKEGTGNLFYVANLTTKNPDGSYTVTVTTRREWDEMIARRRASRVAAAEASETPVGTQPPSSHGSSPGTGATAANSGASAGALGAGSSAGIAKPIVGFTVVVYGASWCEACHEAMNYLKLRRVPAIEKDIETDRGALEEMQLKLAKAGLRGGSIPVIDVNGHILIGFESHQLDAAIMAASGGRAL